MSTRSVRESVVTQRPLLTQRKQLLSEEGSLIVRINRYRYVRENGNLCKTGLSIYEQHGDQPVL